MSHRNITTVEELDALPVGSVVVDPFDEKGDAPVVACKAARGDWGVMGDDPERRWWSHEVFDVSHGRLLAVYVPGGAA